MRARRMRLRLAFWAKLLEMPPTRWPRRLYELGRRNMSPWCRETKEVLGVLGLGPSWDLQNVPPGWLWEMEARVQDWHLQQWNIEVLNSPKLALLATLGPVFGPQEYLGEPVQKWRRLWTKLRSGALELRVETGRWERLPVDGKQAALPRELRRCELCSLETEDERHFLFRCPAYELERRIFMYVCSGTRDAGDAVRVAAECLASGKPLVTGEDELLVWMMQSGWRQSMQYLASVWYKRKTLRKELGIQGILEQ